jgi:hypothetical protein
MKIIALAAAAASTVLASLPAAAKLNSCDGPIVFGTTLSETGPFSTLADRWRKMTEVFAEEINKSGGIAVKACNKKLPLQFVIYDDQACRPRPCSSTRRWQRSTRSTSSSVPTGVRSAARSRRSPTSTRSRW